MDMEENQQIIGGAITGESDNREAAAEKRKLFLSGIVFGSLATILIGLIGVFVFLAVKNNASSDELLDRTTMNKIKSIVTLIDQYYYKSDEISDDMIREGIYKGIVDSLDDVYSDYMGKEELSSALDSYEGIFYGMGATLYLDEKGGAILAAVFEGSGAEAAGLTEGDKIIAVDGESVIGWELNEIVAKVRGEKDTIVKLTISRDSEVFDVDIVRGPVPDKKGNYGVLIANEEIGYIQIEEFDDVTEEQFADALASLLDENIKGLMLDLRGNPGGNVTTVIDVARHILPEGIIVYTEDKNGKKQEYTCDGENQLQIPLVVLVNGYSASASEILSGAIQDYGVGTLVGEQTFGKGVVQRVFGLADNTAVKLTTSYYYTPNGRCINGEGLTPDVIVEFDRDIYEEKGDDNQFNKALEILEEQIK